MSYCFHPAAAAEHLETVAYFESRRPGLGAGYLAEFEKIMTVICAAPHRYPVEKKPDIRRRRMDRYPFTILFRIEVLFAEPRMQSEVRLSRPRARRGDEQQPEQLRGAATIHLGVC